MREKSELYSKWTSELNAADVRSGSSFLPNPMNSPLLRRLASEMKYEPPHRRGMPSRLEQLRAPAAEASKARVEEAKRRDARRVELDRLLAGVEAELEAAVQVGSIEYVEGLLVRRATLCYLLAHLPAEVEPARPGEVEQAVATEVERLRVWVARLDAELDRIASNCAALERSGAEVRSWHHPLREELAAVLRAYHDAEENLRLAGQPAWAARAS